MRNQIIAFFIFLIFFSLGCKKTNMYSGFNHRYNTYSHASNNELICSNDSSAIYVNQNIKYSSKNSFTTSLNDSLSGNFIYKNDKEFRNNELAVKKVKGTTHKKIAKNKKGSFWTDLLAGATVFGLITLVIIGFFFFISILFPGLGITVKFVTIFILSLYTLAILVVLGGSMPKDRPALITPIKPCEEIKCPSYGCENGSINTSQGKITCIRCRGKGTICK